MIGLLNKLKKTKLEITDQTEDIEQAMYNTGKGHLIAMMPELVPCISTKENELREKIKEILFEISEILRVDRQ